MTFLSKLTSPRYAPALFSLALIILYAIVPLFVDALYLNNPYFFELGCMSLLACASVMVGFRSPLLDGRFGSKARYFVINESLFHAVVWAAFALFIAVTFYTAKSIPLWSALAGADANTLSVERGEFLKGRVGAELALLYISTIFVNTLLPYSMVRLFMGKSKWRYPLAGLFFFFSISFLQKTLFLNLILPLGYYAAQRLKINFRKVLLALGTAWVLLYFLTLISTRGESVAALVYGDVDVNMLFSATFRPVGTMEMLLWRIFSVPVFTATDMLLVFRQQLGGNELMGATSSLLSTLFGMQRVNIERMVFAHQFGAWNEIANANAVFFVDAFVNFGWVGIVLFSMFVGQTLRWFYLSDDEAFKALWPLYCFVLLSAPLIGMLFSNGYLYMFFHALFIRLGHPGRKKLEASGHTEVESQVPR